ncbi:MAG: hypothetical protein KAU24_05015 [Candidatus Aenigmarchaeota archaeon]|nr:hypothetical protein [Candidatus Aenigmarchaeota archaeon]
MEKNKKWSLTRFVLGIILALTGAAIMFEGSLFGETTTGAAIVIGIIGICLIATSRIRIM